MPERWWINDTFWSRLNVVRNYCHIQAAFSPYIPQNLQGKKSHKEHPAHCLIWQWDFYSFPNISHQLSQIFYGTRRRRREGRERENVNCVTFCSNLKSTLLPFQLWKFVFIYYIYKKNRHYFSGNFIPSPMEIGEEVGNLMQYKLLMVSNHALTSEGNMNYSNQITVNENSLVSWLFCISDVAVPPLKSQWWHFSLWNHVVSINNKT